MKAPGDGEITRKDVNHNGNRAERSAVHDADSMDWCGGRAGTYERQ